MVAMVPGGSRGHYTPARRTRQGQKLEKRREPLRSRSAGLALSYSLADLGFDASSFRRDDPRTNLSKWPQREREEQG